MISKAKGDGALKVSAHSCASKHSSCFAPADPFALSGAGFNIYSCSEPTVKLIDLAVCLVGWLVDCLGRWQASSFVGLGWVGLGWVGLGWLGWVGLGWVGLGWVGLGRLGLGQVGTGINAPVS